MDRIDSIIANDQWLDIHKDKVHCIMATEFKDRIQNNCIEPRKSLNKLDSSEPNSSKSLDESKWMIIVLPSILHIFGSMHSSPVATMATSTCPQKGV